MNTQTTLQYLTGFIMGVLMGFVLTAIILILYNLFCWWQGCTRVGFTWWNAFPLPLLFGITMAIGIAQLPLGD